MFQQILGFDQLRAFYVSIRPGSISLINFTGQKIGFSTHE
jgi:hypothetical protein